MKTNFTNMNSALPDLPLEIVNKIIMQRPRNYHWWKMEMEMFHERGYGFPNTAYSNVVGNTFCRSYFVKFRNEHNRCDKCKVAYYKEDYFPSKVAIFEKDFEYETDSEPSEPDYKPKVDVYCLKCNAVDHLQRAYWEVVMGFYHEREQKRKLERKYERMKDMLKTVKRKLNHLKDDISDYESDSD